MATLTPSPKMQFFDASGNPLAGGKLYTYSAGTTTPLATYTDSTGITPNTNPVILDSRGEASVWLGESLYYMELKTSTDTLIWSADNIGGIATANSVSRMAVTLTNIAALRATAVSTTYEAITKGYYTAGDGGHGEYYGVTGAAAGTYVDNGGTIIVPTGGNGSSAWKLKFTEINVKQFGAKGDGITDDTTAINSALAIGKNIYGLNGETYKIVQTLNFSTIYQEMNLRGGTLKPTGTFTAISISASYSGLRNVKIDASGLIGNVISNTTAIQHIVLDDIKISNPGSATAIIFKDIYTSWLRRIQITGHGGTAFHFYSSILGTPVNSLWIEDCDISGGVSTSDSILLEAVSGISIINSSFQNNATGSTDIRIKSTVNSGVSGITIENGYFETGVNHTGNCIYIGDPTSGTNDHSGIKITKNKFQVSKRPINIGANVNQNAAIFNNEFISLTGSPAYAISASGSLRMNCHSNTGSQADLDRTFIPALTFGGASTGITFGARSGTYLRIGNRVTGEIKIVLTNKGISTGSAVITGLPIAASSAVEQNLAYSPIYWDMASISGGVFGRISASGSGINLSTGGAAAHTDVTDSMFTNTTNLYLTFSYNV